MKTSLLCLGFSALLAGVASAQSPQALFELTNAPQQKRVLNMDAFRTPPYSAIPEVSKSDDQTQSLNFTDMYYTDFYPYFEIYNDNRTFVYEPSSKTTVLVRTNRVITNNSLTGGQVRLYTTNDNGASWNEIEVYNQQGKLIAFPSLGIVNPQGTGTKFDDLNWVVFGALYESPEWRLGGGIGLFKPASGQFEFPMSGPDNAPADMGWNVYSDMTSMNAPNPSTFLVNRLNKTVDNGPSQYGMYGVWGYDFDAEDFTTNTIPAAWDISQFQAPDPPNLGSTLNPEPLIGADADGKLYMASNLVFTADPGVRTPCVSTSEDQGVTWQPFAKMPKSVMDAYASSRGWNNIQAYRPYDGDAFVVTGSNKWSFIYRVGTAENNAWVGRDIVEAAYDNGTWTMSKIGELAGFPLEFVREDTNSDKEGENAWIPLYSLSSRGNEVEVAITADGKDLLVKWIDDNPAIVDSGFSQRVYYRNNAGTLVEDQLTGMNATDIFMASKAVNGSSWSTPLNMTNDITYDHGTHIPAIIESLTNVPLLTLKTITKAGYNQNYQYLPAISQLPDIILDAHVDWRTPNRIRTAFINSTSVSDVKDEAHYSFRVNSIAPNPATNEAELAFTMDTPGAVSVSVFTNTGMQVASVYDGVLNAGVHGLTINSENLASGTYYVVLNIGSQRISRPLVVVR